MSVLIDCLVIVFAASHLVDLWFNGSLSLIATRRAYVEASRYGNDSFFIQLFSCSYCLAHWVVLLVAFSYWNVPGCHGAMQVLACIRLVILANMLLPRSVRFQRGTDSQTETDRRV